MKLSSTEKKLWEEKRRNEERGRQRGGERGRERLV